MNATRAATRPAAAEFTSFDELTAFDREVAAIEPELRRFVARRIDSESVDDILQEVWVAAWQSLPKYDHRSKFRTWVYGICLNKCHDHYRKRSSESRWIPLDQSPLIDGRPSAEHALIQWDTVDRMLQGIDETQREVLELYYYAQLTLAEIAEVLSRNLNTVKYQFYRAHSEMLAIAKRENLV